MKICFPIESFEGLNSQVYGHFGSAAGFVLVDTESNSIEEIRNDDAHHAHGMCQPVRAMGGRAVDAVAVTGIGMGALMALRSQGIKVYRAASGSVDENVKLMAGKGLPEFQAGFTCPGHSGGGCSH